MKTIPLLSTLFCLAIIAGCGSSPRSDYYMLTANAPGIPGGGGPSIGIGPVSVPEYLNTRQIVMNRNAHKLELAEFDRWAEPLDEGVSRVVAVNLAVMMNTADVQIFPWRRDAVPEYAARVTVVQFAAQGNEALLVTEWAVTRPGEGVAVDRGISQLTTTLKGGEPEHVASAYSELLLQLSEIIAAAVRADLGKAAREA